jgi:peptidoglycan/LPS O-acetylase OafA/YrhL
MRPEHARLQALDLFRFCAAAGVMVYHLTYLPTFVAGGAMFAGLGAVTRFGFLGVELFFLISGFVILWSADNRSAFEFGVSRVSRLMPSYWVSMTLTCVGLAVLAGKAWSASTLAANAAMAAGYLGIPYVDGVYYTLVVEIKFYAIVFLLVLFRQMPRIEYWLLGWVIALIPAFFFPVPGLRSLTIYPYGPFFAAGGLFFLWWKNGFAWRRLIAIAVACFLGCVCVYRISPDFLNGDHSAGALGTAAGIVLALYVLFAGVSSGGLRIRHTALWATLGAMTYPLYLLHNALGKEVARHLEGSVGTVMAIVLCASLSLLLAFVLAKTTERQGCAWLRRWLLALRGLTGGRTEPAHATIPVQADVPARPQAK